MNIGVRKLIALVATVVLLVVGLPVVSFAEEGKFEQLFSYQGANFVSSDWKGTNGTPTFDSNGLSTTRDNNNKDSIVTYKDKYNLSNGFEFSYSAQGRKSYNNIYDGSYYAGVKIGNITVAMDRYVKPVILVDGVVKANGGAIIAYNSSVDIANWLRDDSTGESSFDIRYTVKYDARSKKLTYAKHHDDNNVFTITYTDAEGLIDLSNASVSLYHNNSWGFNCTYSYVNLAVDTNIPDTSDMPGGACGDNAKWAFDEATGTLYIIGSGETYNYANVGNTVPWLGYRTKITGVVVGDEITYLGNRLFRGLNYVTTAKFGKNVKKVGYELFYVCNRLEEVKLNEGLTNLGALTFYNCTALKQVTIPTTVTNIENRAFKGSGLTSVVVPDTVTKTGYEVFMNCTNLAEVDYTEGVSMLNPCTFMNCTALTRFDFTQNMCRIRSNAFNGCTALQKVYFENDAMMWGSSNGQEAKIASNAFDGCAATLKLTGIKGGHVEIYASNHGLVFVDKNGGYDTVLDGEYEKYSGTRDPWLWPFAATSIWNMPIGSDAILQKANFQSAYSISIDEEYHVKVPAGSPTVDVYAPSSWQTRWPGNRKLGTMQVPADFYLADARQGSTPNNCAAFLMPDGRTIRQLEPTCRLETGNARIVGYLHSEDQDIYGAGIKGTHYGSGLSAIGGSIRKGELTSDEPIRHALKLNFWCKKYAYYDYNTQKGYIWPADRHDSYATSGGNAYGGTNPNLRMGTLLTIPQDVTPEALGLKTEVGKKLFYALQNYGCYIVDDSAWDSYAFSAETGVEDEVQMKYGINLNTNRNRNDAYYQDSLALIQSLYIVTNNSPTSIGGGGTPCKPLAPDFK